MRIHHSKHQFDGDESDVRCLNCDCRPGGRWSRLSCNLQDEIAAIGATNPTHADIIGRHRNEFAAGAYITRWGDPEPNRSGWTNEQNIAYELGVIWERDEDGALL